MNRFPFAPAPVVPCNCARKRAGGGHASHLSPFVPAAAAPAAAGACPVPGPLGG